MIFTVPDDGTKFYPTLGPQVCDFAEKNLVRGPGDLRGKPLVLDDRERAFIFRMYEVFPRRHKQAGRRRFQRAGISRRKGLAKTELGAIVAILELHPEAPVRFDRWTKDGEPIGKGVTDPYIPMVAYTEEQSDELAFGAMRAILDNSHLRHDFDIGLERIRRRKGDGVAVSLSANPNARDGARTTFSLFDETHRMTLARLRAAHTTMVNNLPKRKLAQAWMLEITTAPEPGAGSVAEATMEFAREIEAGRVKNASFFYFHEQAGQQHDWSTEEGVRAGVIEASGPAAAWSDIEGIVNIWKDPKSDRAYHERVYGNRLVKGGTQAFDVLLWRALAKPGYMPAPGALITIGFDGGKTFDSTGMVATEVETNFQWKAGVWERPVDLPREKAWQVPTAEVDAIMQHLFDTYDVWRLYADPPYWQEQIAIWRGRWGEERVIEWWTTRDRQMTTAIEGFTTAISDGTISHAGDPDVERHMGNARKRDLNRVDEIGQKLYVIQKERKDSPKKMDLAMCSVLSEEARTDAIAAGAMNSEETLMEIVVI